MEVILLKDVEKLGRKGEVVNVRKGYGRNYLFPRVLALPATRESKAWIESEKKRSTRRRAGKKQETEKLAGELSSLRLRLELAVGSKDKAFGSITAQDLVEALAGHGISLDKKQIRLPGPLKSLGTYEVTVELDPEVKPTLQVEVVKKS